MNKEKKRVCAFKIKILIAMQSNKEFMMKKTLCLLTAILITGALLVSCGSTGGGKAPIGAEGIPQPEWVRKLPPVTADAIYFVGEGRDGKTVTSKKASARANGLQALADWKESKVLATVRDYINESGETGNTQSLESLQNAVIGNAKANTSGFREVESWIAADGHYVILYSYPINDFRNDFKSATNAFVRNESALYAEFKADQMFKILEEKMGE